MIRRTAASPTKLYEQLTAMPEVRIDPDAELKEAHKIHAQSDRDAHDIARETSATTELGRYGVWGLGGSGTFYADEGLDDFPPHHADVATYKEGGGRINRKR